MLLYILAFLCLHLIDQVPTERGVEIGSPSSCIRSQFDLDLVPRLQLQEHGVPSVVSEAFTGSWVIVGHGDYLVILAEAQHGSMFLSVVIEEAEEVNT